QILFGNAKTVAGLAHERQPGPAHVGEIRSADQEAGALARAAPNAAAQLVKLGEAEALRALDNHQRGVVKVDADLDHGGRNQHGKLARGEARHRRILFRPFHSAVDEADLVVAETLLEDSRALLG